MADDSDKRMKFCRYCDGMIEWGTKVCPHCNQSLEVVEFDDMDFTTGSGPAISKVSGLREKPKLPKDMEEARKRALERRKAKAAQPKAPAKPAAPPQLQPIAPPPGAPPQLTPISPPPAPPVVKPIRPPREPDDMETQVLPVMEPLEPVEDIPVMQPLDTEVAAVPVLPPVDAGELPAGVAEVLDCPVCGSDMGPGDQGGTCGSCGSGVCIVCLMRANAVRVSNDPAGDRSRWLQHTKRVPAEAIRCPACGKQGVTGS